MYGQYQWTNPYNVCIHTANSQSTSSCMTNTNEPTRTTCVYIPLTANPLDHVWPTPMNQSIQRVYTYREQPIHLIMYDQHQWTNSYNVCIRTANSQSTWSCMTSTNEPIRTTFVYIPLTANPLDHVWPVPMNPSVQG